MDSRVSLWKIFSQMQKLIQILCFVLLLKTTLLTTSMNLLQFHLKKLLHGYFRGALNKRYFFLNFVEYSLFWHCFHHPKSTFIWYQKHLGRERFSPVECSFCSKSCAISSIFWATSCGVWCVLSLCYGMRKNRSSTNKGIFNSIYLNSRRGH